MTRALLAFAACLMLTSACTRSHSIAGTWRSTSQGDAMVWRFEGNGSVVQGTVRGRYSFGDNERVKIETPFATSVYRMQLSGDKLTLIDARGGKLEFTRVRESTR